MALAITRSEGLLKAKYPQSTIATATTDPPPGDSKAAGPSPAGQVSEGKPTQTTHSTSSPHTPQHTQLFVEGLESQRPYRAERFGVRVRASS